MIPTCAIHQKPMRMGTSGTYFCPTLLQTNPDGSKVWCTYKLPKQVPEQATTPQNHPEQEELVSETIQSPPTSYKVRDYEAEARGKIRSLFVESLIAKRGLEHPTIADINILNEWVEYAMDGEMPKISEDLSDEELTAVGRESEERD